LEFDQIFDYVAGKADWLAAGEPTEGPGANTARVGSIADREVPTCSLETPVEELAAWLEDGDLAVVVDGRVVLGLVRRSALDGKAGRSAAEVMETAPPTIRADVKVEELADRFAKPKIDVLLVTTPQAELIGVLRQGAH
jgi:CBS domain-containing protein